MQRKFNADYLNMNNKQYEIRNKYNINLLINKMKKEYFFSTIKK